MTDEQHPLNAMNVHSRMDTQDALLREIRDMIVGHIAEEKERVTVGDATKKALDEIVLLWRASKVIIPALVALAIAVISIWGWTKEHIK